MTIQWYQILVMIITGMVGVLLAVLIGGWLVFRSKTITMPTQFFNPVKQPKHSQANYLPSSLNEYPQEIDEALSPAAARLRAQKIAPADGKDAVMSFVKGSK